jgi:hypothetical protein
MKLPKSLRGTIWDLLDRDVRHPIEHENHEHFWVTNHTTGEEELVSSNEEIKSDVDLIVLRNIQRRQKNISREREGD